MQISGIPLLPICIIHWSPSIHTQLTTFTSIFHPSPCHYWGTTLFPFFTANFPSPTVYTCSQPTPFHITSSYCTTSLTLYVGWQTTNTVAFQAHASMILAHLHSCNYYCVSIFMTVFILLVRNQTYFQLAQLCKCPTILYNSIAHQILVCLLGYHTLYRHRAFYRAAVKQGDIVIRQSKLDI